MAVIDIGSIAARLIIGTIKNRQFVSHLFTRVPLSLGADSYQNHVITLPTQKRLIMALDGLHKIAQSMQVSRCQVVATAAIRDCANQKQLLSRVRRQIGINIQVLDSHQEATFVGKFVARQFPKSKSLISIDTGGGSADCAHIRGGDIIETATFNIGATRKNGGAAAAKTKMKTWLSQQCGDKTTVTVSGGGMRKIAEHCRPFNIDKLNQFTAQARGMSVQERIYHFDLTPDRARVIIIGAQIAQLILQASDTRVLHTVKGGLGEAILTAMFENIF